MAKFRQFIKEHSFTCLLKEDEAAPSMGSNSSAPTDPQNNTTNKFHPEVLGRELGINDEDFSAALESDAVTLYGPKIPDFGWPFRVAGNINVSVKDRGDESYDVTFPLSMMFRDNPKLFIHRYSSDKNPMYWDGTVEDQTEYMGLEQLMDAWVEPLAQAGGGAGGMGGAPPMGGMGGPPMGMGGM